MFDPDNPVCDARRLAALRSSGMLDSPPEASFDRLVRLASRLTRATGAAVSLVDDHRQFFKAAVGLDEESARARETPLDRSICAHVVAEGRTLALPDTRAALGIAGSHMQAYLGVPILTGDGFILGSFCVFDASLRDWSDDDIATITDLAASVGTEIELRVDIARRARLELELSAAKGRFEAYMQNSPVLAFAKDRGGRLTYANARFFQHFSHHLDNVTDWLGKTDYEVWPDDVAEQFRVNDQKVWEGAVPIEFIEETLTRDGRRDRFLVLKFPYTTPDGEQLLGGTAIDISDLLQAQEALRRSEAESRTLGMVVARIDGAVAIADADGRLGWVSEPYARLFGETPEAVMGQDLIRRSLGPDADPAEVATLRARLLAGDRIEVAAVRRDARGRKAWLELEVQPVRGEPGSADQFIAIGRDVTDRRRSEGKMAALRECDAVLFESNSLDEAIPRLLRNIGLALDMDGATYWRGDGEPGPPPLEAAWHWDRVSRCAAEPVGPLDPAEPTRAGAAALARQVWGGRRPICREDLESDSAAGPGAADPAAPGPAGGVRGAFGWPVLRQGRVVGVFTFASHEPVAGVDELATSLQRQVDLFVGRKLVEEERNRLVAIFEASDDFVGIADLDGLVIWRNAAYHRLVGRDPGEPGGGFPLQDTYPDWAADLLMNVAYPEAARSGSWLGETAIQDADGRVIPMSQRVMAHRGPDGAVAYYATIIRDISAAKVVEAELLAAKEAAEAASRAKGDFLANMSHEIRTPMNGIIGMTELTLDTDLSPLQREYLGLVRSSAESLMRVINDILDFSKIESGRFELEVIPFNLHELLYATLRPLALRAHGMGLELACRVAPGVPEIVEGDPHRLRQILVNLVGNAVKFTPTGEVVVEVAPAPPGPAAGPDAPPADPLALRFTVVDTGIGIPPHKLAAIFEPFEQADGSTTRTYGGTGLGLTISSELVRLMEGRLWVESAVGQGSTFAFTGRFRVAADQPEHPEVAALAGRRVLVAVAGATRRRLTAEVLDQWGALPREVVGSLPALEELRRAARAGTPYHCAVVDDQLSDLSGFDLISLIHNDPKLAPTGLVMMTTAGRSDMGRCEEQEVAHCVAKPVSPGDLLAALVAALESAPIAAAPPAPAPAGATDGDAIRRAAGAGAGSAPAQPAAPGRPLRVLLAEDQLVNRKVAARMLERLGHSVVTARDGREVLDLLGGDSFDVVLMDIQMPVMDGFEAAAAIRRAEPGPVALIALTAHAMMGDRERCLAAGFDDYLSKPIRSEDLRAALDRLPVGGPRPADQRVAT